MGSSTDMTSVCSEFGYNLTVVTGASIDSVQLFDYDIVHIPSAHDHVANGISLIDHTKIIARSGDLGQFLASGGGISSLAQTSTDPTPWNWFPYGPIGSLDFGVAGITATLQLETGFGETVYDPTVIIGTPYHNTFDSPLALFGLIPCVTMAVEADGNSTTLIRLNPEIITDPARHVGLHGNIQYENATLDNSQSQINFPEPLGLNQDTTAIMQDPNDLVLSTFQAAIHGEHFVVVRCLNDDFAEFQAIILEDVTSFSINNAALSENYILESRTFESGFFDDNASNTPAGWALRETEILMIFIDAPGEDIQIGQIWVDITEWAGRAEIGSVVAMGHKHAPLNGLYGFDINGNPT